MHSGTQDAGAVDCLLVKVSRLRLQSAEQGTHARSGAPPAAWQGPKSEDQSNLNTSLDEPLKGRRFRLIVDD